MKIILKYLFLLTSSWTILFINNDFNCLNKKLIEQKIDEKFNQKKVDYLIPNNNIEMISDLISKSGNTNYKPVIQVKTKDLSKQSPVILKIKINSHVVNLEQSYYEKGIVENNNFKGNNIHNNLYKNNFTIQNNGIYRLYLVSNAGNSFESYLELGYDNWQILYNFDDNWLSDSATELNVKVPSLDKMVKDKKIKISNWLNNYKFNVEQLFLNNLNKYSKGFDISIDDFENRYQDILDHVDFSENNEIIIKTKKLIAAITNVAINKLQDALLKSEANINMHGYSLDQLLNRNQLPDTKQKIDNYANNKSFGKWLQDQANIKFYFWLWTIKISTFSVILLLLISALIICLYIRYRRIYQPITLKKINFTQQQKYVLQQQKIIFKVAKFIKLNQKNNLWNKDRLNSYYFIKEIFSNNLDNIQYNRYDNIYYNKTNKTYLVGKEFIQIFLNSNNVSEYNKKLKSYYPNYDKGKLHRTVLYDILVFYLNKNHHSKILKLEKDFDSNTRMDLAAIRKYLKNQEWSYYFYDLQNITHKSIIKFLNWQNKPLNYSAYGKVLKRKLHWILNSQEEVQSYLTIVENINLYRNILCKASPLKHDKFNEWKELNVMQRTDLAWNMYLDLTKLIKFINQNIS